MRRLSDAEVIDSYTARNVRRLTRMLLKPYLLADAGPWKGRALQGSAFPNFAALSFLLVPVLTAQFRVPRAPGRDEWLAKPAAAVALCLHPVRKSV